MEERCPACDAAETGVSIALVGTQASRTWRRQLGALAWAALEELALTACPDPQGWVSPAGVHTLATGVGTTDSYALRAVAALARAGLVALEPVTDAHGRPCFGYRLHLPQGIAMRDSPGHEGVAQGVPGWGPNDRDAGSSDTHTHPHQERDGRLRPRDRDGMWISGPLVPDHQAGEPGARNQR